MVFIWPPVKKISAISKSFFFTTIFLLHIVLSALSKINDAINSGDPAAILRMLQDPAAKLKNVRPKNAELYAIILREARDEKAKVF